MENIFTRDWAVGVIQKTNISRNQHAYKIKWIKAVRFAAHEELTRGNTAQYMTLRDAKELVESVEHYFSPGTYYSSESMAQIIHEANEIFNDEDLRVNSDGSMVRKLWDHERRILWWAQQIRQGSSVVYC